MCYLIIVVVIQIEQTVVEKLELEKKLQVLQHENVNLKATAAHMDATSKKKAGKGLFLEDKQRIIELEGIVQGLRLDKAVSLLYSACGWGVCVCSCMLVRVLVGGCMCVGESNCVGENKCVGDWCVWVCVCVCASEKVSLVVLCEWVKTLLRM